MKLRKVLKTGMAVICCSIFLFNFTGCRNYREENKQALKYLSDKYGEEFELDGYLSREGNDEFRPSPIKSTKAWPKENPDEIFTIKLDEDKTFCDNYQNILMKPHIKDYLSDISRVYWNNCSICVNLDGGFTTQKFDENNCLDFLQNGKVITRIFIYEQYTSNFNIDKEADLIYKFYTNFISMKLGGEIRIAYTSENIVGQKIDTKDFWNSLEKSGSIKKKYFIDYSKSYPDGNKEVTTETIKEKLEENEI